MPSHAPPARRVPRVQTGTRFAAGGLLASLLLHAGTTFAAGLDRSGQSIAPLFDDGNRFEAAVAYTRPDVSGVQSIGGAASTGNVGEQQIDVVGNLKVDLTPAWSLAFIIDHPYGAAVQYQPGSIFQSRVDGSTTDVRSESESLTALTRYKLNRFLSVHGGLRAQQIDGAVALRGAAYGRLDGYDVHFSRDRAVGLVLGAAVEVPEIAFRLAATWSERIEHEVATRESFRFGATRAAPSTTRIVSPSSINVRFQVGVAENTLLFGNVRHANWEGFDITPAALKAASNASLVSFSKDGLTFGLGLGHRFNDAWSGAVELGYEPQKGGFTSTLGPTDGFWSAGVGAAYSFDDSTVSFGVRYVDVGDATAAVGGTVVGEFRHNTAVVSGLRFKHRF